MIVFNCEKCNNKITTNKPVGRMKRCPQCGQVNLVPMDSENLTESSNESKLDLEQGNKKIEKLSEKYSELEGYQALAYLMMIASTGFFIYAIVQFGDAPKAARKMLENAMITSTVSYVITMFSLFCLTKIIDFLFDLDKKTNL